MSALKKGDRVVYTGKGVWSNSPEAVGQVGTVRTMGMNTAEVVWDSTDPQKTPPMGCFTDNLAPATADNVNHPSHYRQHPSGVECITITQHMGFCLGNVIKYVWRADLKGNAIEDLEKAQKYLTFELDRLKAAANG